ncbi:hypothetical protein QVD17_28292 [Tagetes erecta]|uniref:Uncharacterized protein n=1 Tax=Tagetes erecta TaxID=13708 RepID=A0AAD8NRZ8_TARER|nr:hypothetical protein QVD17_28292 [Tagetes erecta]
MQYAYSPCTPAHNIIKESPLSSDTIFKQESCSLFCFVIVAFEYPGDGRGIGLGGGQMGGRSGDRGVGQGSCSGVVTESMSNVF